MPVILEDRPIEQVREEVIDQLIVNYSHAMISSEAFERRLDQAIASQVHQALVSLVADLELQTDSSYEQKKDSRFNFNYSNAEVESNETIVNIFGGSNRSGQWTVPREIRIFTVFGGSNFDFSDAVFSSPQVTIKVFCLFGGENISVPENINVVCKAFSILGGTNNKAPSMASRQAPTVTIKGLLVFGGVNIRIKRTIKEKFVSFANQLKAMFN